MSDLRTPLKTLMSRLELVANEHPELFDTQVRESLSEALACVAFSILRPKLSQLVVISGCTPTMGIKRSDRH